MKSVKGGSVIDAATFQSLRPYLFSVAYRMLGSAAESEDVVQDAWLRSASAPDGLASPKAWLTTVVTRLCLDHLKSARVQREEYVGPWLPEPVPTAAVATGEDLVARQESITLAFLVLLETLSPAERAAFLLREVFDRDYDEVADTLETTPAAARQLVHRAKTRIEEGRPRFTASPDGQREIVAAFFAAVQEGDLTDLERYLAADVIYTADGGGKVAAARKRVHGAATVARLMHALVHKAAVAADATPGAWTTDVGSLNGESALLVHHRGRLDTVFVFSTEDGRITAIRAIRNPDKLAWLEQHGSNGAS
jgi:RNA polymerase sigma-70 factor (ECF subfamily)